MSAGFLLYFYALYFTADVVTSCWTTRLPLFLDIELRIPFIAEMAPVYVSMNALLLLGPFVYRTPRALWPLVGTLAAETTVAAVIFMLVPIDMRFPPESPGGVSGFFYTWADTANLDHNELPSLHVAFAVTAAWALGRRANRATRLGLALWATAISASTVLIHAHYLLDVVLGIALGCVGMRTVFPRLGELEGGGP